MQSLAWDMGLQVKLAVHADSSAAIGICRRSGIGRVRHLAVGQFWVQQRIRQAAFTLHKVRGDCNPAGLCTKHLERATADHPHRLAGLHFEAGRASSAPLVSASVELASSKSVSLLRTSTRLTPNDEEECETVELNLCRLCCMRRA